MRKISMVAITLLTLNYIKMTSIELLKEIESWLSFNTEPSKEETAKELLEEFIDWARDCGEDAWYVFENTDEAIERFMAQRDYGDEFLGDAGS